MFVRYAIKGLIHKHVEIRVDCPVCDELALAPITLGPNAKTRMTNIRMRLSCGHVVKTDIIYPPGYEGLRHDGTDCSDHVHPDRDAA